MTARNKRASFEANSPSHETVTRTFIGRHRELRFLATNLIPARPRGPQAVYIVGGAGTGKTSLVSVFLHRYSKQLESEVFGIYAHELPVAGDDFFQRVRGSRTVRPLVVIDEFDSREPETWNWINTFLFGKIPVRLILITRNEPLLEPLDYRAPTLRLTNFSREEVGSLAERLLEHATPVLIAALMQTLGGNPLATTLALGALRVGAVSSKDLRKLFQPFSKSGLLGPNGRPLDQNSPQYQAIVTDISTVSTESLRNLARDPGALWKISPRFFEEVVAEIFKRKGYEVTLTPASRDGGKDVYAAKKDAVGSFLYIVECKRYGPDNPVGVGLVRSLYGVVEAEKATAGIIATTSFFTKGAKEFQSSVKFRINLQDFLGIKEWLTEVTDGYV